MSKEMLKTQTPSKLKADEYAEFLAKFETKKTTDDCYTPPAVYQAVYDYVDAHIISLKDKTVVRPFYPDGDYEAEATDYDENTIVIDNPPFSMSASIQQFYQRNNVKFFLFCPALTAFSTYPGTKSSCVLHAADITYTNGAKVKTAFATNLLGNVAIKGCPILSQKITITQQSDKPKRPKYIYSDNVVTVSAIHKIVGGGGNVEIMHDEIVFTRQLDAQKASKKAIFGAGFLVGDGTAERIKAERIKAERIKAERIKAERKGLYWQLSKREMNLIKTANPNQLTKPCNAGLFLWS